MALEGGSKAMQGLSDESLLFECSPCKYEDIRREASSFCQECGDYLCDSCKQSHQRFTGTRKHHVVSGNLMPEKRGQSGEREQNRVTCVCNSREVTVYCKDHNTVICVDCKTLKHRNCQSLIIDQACASIKTPSVNQSHNRMKQLKDDLETLQKKRREDMESLATQTTKCRDVVMTFKEELIQHIEEMSKIALEDIRKCEDGQNSTIQQHISTCFTALNRLNADYQHFDEATTSADKTLTFIRNLQLTQTMDDVEHVLKDIEKEIKVPSIFFESEKTLKQNDIKSLGVVRSLSDTKRNQTCLKKMNIKSIVKVDAKFSSETKDPKIYGSLFMSSGELVLCDGNNNSVMVLNLDFSFKEKIKVTSYPWNVSAINKEEAVVSLPANQMLQFIKVLPKLQLGSSIKLDRMCYGVAVKDKMIYVSYTDGEIGVLDRDGQQQTIVNSSFQSGSLLTISVTQAGILAVSQYTADNVRVFNNGKEMFTYSNPGLICPKGLYIDMDENVLVCGFNSHNVHMIDKTGRLIKILLSACDGLHSPYTVSFRPSDKTLLVGGESLIICKLG